MNRLLAILAAFGASSAAAQERAPVLVELFTSQSCSSCPPAEALLRELSAQPQIVALEWHVDYWNAIATADGRWRDPFSSAANTARQRRYNLVLRGGAAVYTPQAVVNGKAEAVGSDRRAVDRLIATARPAAAAIEARAAEGRIAVAVREAPGAQVSLAYFRRSAETRVAGGENAGRELAEANVVVRTIALGRTANGSADFAAPAPGAGEGCAVLVESAAGVAARYC